MAFDLKIASPTADVQILPSRAKPPPKSFAEDPLSQPANRGLDDLRRRYSGREEIDFPEFRNIVPQKIVNSEKTKTPFHENGFYSAYSCSRQPHPSPPSYTTRASALLPRELQGQDVPQHRGRLRRGLHLRGAGKRRKNCTGSKESDVRCPPIAGSTTSKTYTASGSIPKRNAPSAS